MHIRSSEDLGGLVRSLRLKRVWSQQALADKAGVGRRFISELENGKANVQLNKVLDVLRALRARVDAVDADFAWSPAPDAASHSSEPSFGAFLARQPGLHVRDS